MSFEFLDVELRSSQHRLDITQAYWFSIMESGARRTGLVEGKIRDNSTISQVNGKRSFSISYFSIESLLVLLCLTASLLILPVILPPLPPPPFMLLLLPIGILVILLVLAFMPSDVRDIATSYV